MDRKLERINAGCARQCERMRLTVTEIETERRSKWKEAASLGINKPLQRLFPEPVALSQAAQVDGLSVRRVLPGHINLERKRERDRLRCHMTVNQKLKGHLPHNVRKSK